MPIHDWSQVGAGTFHDFHCAWIVEIRNELNTGRLPISYYAQIEDGPEWPLPDRLVPPNVRFTATAESELYAFKHRTLVVRQNEEDRVVGLIEILSPTTKGSAYSAHALVHNAVNALMRGYHLLLIDLHPPGRRDPQGIHGSIWEELCDGTFAAPPDKPLTLAAYSAGREKAAYVDPIAIGDTMPDMPLFLTPNTYVPVPLEATYQGAYRGVPRRWRTVLEGLKP
jgi:Protein of unknown function (DUF4058)